MPPTPEMLPNLLIPGAMRSGTTAMHTLLAQHPDIYMSSYKEPNVLANPQKDVADYRRLFANAPAARYRGESSTMYMILPEAISKMALLPDLRLIIMLRNPVDRAWSHYWYINRFNIEPRSFRDAFLANIDVAPTFSVHNTNYFQVGLYAKWLGVLEEKVPVERVLVVLFDDFVADVDATMRQVTRFLEIPYFRPSGGGRRNESGVMNHTTVLRSYVATTHAVGATVGRVLPSRVYNALSDVNHRTARALYRRFRQDDTPVLPDGDREWIAGFYRHDVDQLRQRLQRTLPWPDFAE